MIELIRSAHSLGEANFHLQFTPKYRRDVFRDSEVRRVCEASFRETAARYGFAVHAVEFGPDHVHLFVGACKNLSVSELARLLKGASARRLRSQCWGRIRSKLWGASFWTGGYFYRSVGATTNEAIRFYLEHSQRKHWTAVDHQTYLHSKQQRLNNYLAKTTTP
jgi:putative transposase